MPTGLRAGQYSECSAPGSCHGRPRSDRPRIRAAIGARHDHPCWPRAALVPVVEVARQAEPQVQPKALDLVTDLQLELMMGKGGDDDQIARLIDRLVYILPEARGPVLMTFRSPAVRGITGPTTEEYISHLETA